MVAKKGYAIVAKPHVYSIKTSAEPYLGMAIAVLDEQAGVVLGKVDEDHVMVVDALTPSELSIDTANYKIKEGVIVFGVRTTRRNNSDAAPMQESIMNMYEIDRGVIRRIAGPIMMDSYNGAGNGDYKFSSSERLTFISILASKTDAYFDMRARIKDVAIRRCYELSARPGTLAG